MGLTDAGAEREDAGGRDRHKVRNLQPRVIVAELRPDRKPGSPRRPLRIRTFAHLCARVSWTMIAAKPVKTGGRASRGRPSCSAWCDLS